MNYQNPFLNPYGYGQQMPQGFMQPGMGTQVQTPQMPGQQVVRVNGENGARAYQIGPNSSALLLDEGGVIVWLVTTDGAGYKTVAPYDIMPHKTEAAPDYSDLESRVRKLEETINGGKRYGNAGNPSAAGKRTNDPDGGKDSGNGRCKLCCR